MDKGTINVKIWVLSRDLDPDEISVMLNLKPTAAFRKGDRRGKGSLEFDRCHWHYESGPQEELVAWEKAKAMIAIVQDHQEAFKKLRNAGADLGFGISFRTGDYSLGMVLANDDLRLLATCGFMIDIALY